ncbi:PLP-dependent aminotransferase family protein [Streptomyces sp. NPDC088253]|uniref:aminotransferase-like domain-containing protein n=1 Tax=Streptomyces sp. NPDC088253 TaxID=3365846 RepID=UPI0038010ACC
MTLLGQDQLHASLTDPVLSSIGFLNEVMTRFPEAISFAPGAPHLAHLMDTDLSRYIELFGEHLRATRGFDAHRVRRLLYEYGPARGLINDLVAAAVRADHGIDVPDRAVVITVGAQEAMLLTLRALFRDRSDVLAVVEPCFVGILGAARLLDIEVVAVPERADGPDLDALEETRARLAAQGRRIRAMYVAPDHANPSGTVMDLAARRALLAAADRSELMLIEDNAYCFTAAPGTELPSLKALPGGERVVQIGTFAKLCLPGARVGYAIADQQMTGADGALRLLADDLAALKSMVTVNTSPLCQAVIAGMLLEQGGSLAALGRRRGTLYRRNLGLLLQALDRHVPPLPDVRWNRPQGGFFVRMQLPVPVDEALLERSAARFGVLWTPMAQFYLSDAGERELRLSCSYLDPEQIDQGVRRLAAFLREVAAPVGAGT